MESEMTGNLATFLENEMLIAGNGLGQTICFSFAGTSADQALYNADDVVKICFIGEPALIRYVLIGYNLMEVLHFLRLNQARFPSVGFIALAAVGLKPSFRQAVNLKEWFPHARWSTLFSADIFGHCADIILATGSQYLPVAIYLGHDATVHISFRTKEYRLQASSITLNAFEKAVKQRFGVKACKPRENHPLFSH